MAKEFSFNVRGANGVLSYRNAAGSYFSASVRVKTLSYNYGVTSSESHARDDRAFYPHRRVQGQFRLVLDCIGYKEFSQLMTWLKNYSDGLLAGGLSSSSTVTMMDVNVAARRFHKVGVLTSGIADQDQTGSMVFNPELIFVTVMDPADSVTSLTTTRSTFVGPEVDANKSLAFYPASVSKYKDAALYDNLGAVDPHAAVVSLITDGTNFVPSPTGGKQAF